MGKKRGSSSVVNVLFAWVRRQSVKVKTFIGVTIALCAFFPLWFFVEDHNYFFLASEAIHAAGILVLIYKLTTQKTCSGLSLRSQELTALFLAVRMVISAIMAADVHTMLDLATLISTAWVMYMMRFKLKSSYIKELDNMPLYYIVVPCAVLAVLVYPYTIHRRIFRMFWAFCLYLESVSVLPQLRLMQKAKMIEPFTAHYVFALGIARFFSCAHWIIMVYETRGKYILMAGSGYFWYLAAFVAEIVQTFILADFCYYYVKRSTTISESSHFALEQSQLHPSGSRFGNSKNQFKSRALSHFTEPDSINEALEAISPSKEKVVSNGSQSRWNADQQMSGGESPTSQVPMEMTRDMSKPPKNFFSTSHAVRFNNGKWSKWEDH